MQKEIQESISMLLEKQQSLLLSTLKEEKGISQPYSSYAPYVYVCREQDHAFYVFLSDLSDHSQHLRNKPEASILIIEDEVNSEQIFARVRVQYQVFSYLIDDMKERQQAIEMMKQRFGDIIDVLSSLSDFRIFKLVPNSGRYIEGFGRAFNIHEGLSSKIQPVMQEKKN